MQQKPRSSDGTPAIPVPHGRRLVLATAALLVMASTVPTGAAAQTSWPSAKPITLIAPYPAGGGVDAVARLLAERLGARLSQTVNVDNRPGAGSTIGAASLARSAPDGYTLMLGSIVDYAIATHVHKNLSFDPARDLLPVVEVGYGTVGLIVTADLPAKNLKELIALAKSKPGELSYASSGVGGLQHLNAEMFKQMAGVDMVHVPYKGTAQFLPDLISGRIPLSIDSIPAHLANVRAGKTRALAVASATRSPTLPDVPTMAEAGLAGYESATNYTVFVPAKTPPEIVKRLNTELNTILADAELAQKLSGLGITVLGGTSAAAVAKQGTEAVRWAEVIRRGNLTFN